MKKTIWQIINVGGQVLFFVVNLVLLIWLATLILSTSTIKVGDREYKRVGTVNIYSADGTADVVISEAK